MEAHGRRSIQVGIERWWLARKSGLPGGLDLWTTFAISFRRPICLRMYSGHCMVRGARCDARYSAVRVAPPVTHARNPWCTMGARGRGSFVAPKVLSGKINLKKFKIAISKAREARGSILLNLQIRPLFTEKKILWLMVCVRLPPAAFCPVSARWPPLLYAPRASRPR